MYSNSQPQGLPRTACGQGRPVRAAAVPSVMEREKEDTGNRKEDIESTSKRKMEGWEAGSKNDAIARVLPSASPADVRAAESAATEQEGRRMGRCRCRAERSSSVIAIAGSGVWGPMAACDAECDRCCERHL